MNQKTEHDYAMKGCICKKKSSPYYYAEITYKQADGTVKRISRTTKCRRKYDAGRRMDEMINELKIELSSKEKNYHELTQFIHDWLEKVESNEIEATTLETYRRHFTAYIQPFFESLNLTVEGLRPIHLWNFIDFGVPLRPLRISNNFRRLLAENKLPHIRFHDLRHSVATYMLSMGVPIAEISAWLGHKSVSTTSNIYAHITDDMCIATARWMDSGYDPNHNGNLKKVTLEEAI